jgi:aminoacrylate peracid reductase
MSFKVIVPEGAPAPIAPYSPGVLTGGVLYVSGTLDFTPDGRCAHPGDAAAQTRGVLEIIKAVVEAAGATMADIAFNQLFLADFADFPAVNKVYAEYFPGPKPARYAIQCTLVRPEFLVEIASTAHVGKS